MSTNGQTTERRLQALELACAAVTRSNCKLCGGRGSIIIGMPEDAADNDPRYNPTACPECGTPLHRVLQLVGMNG